MKLPAAVDRISLAGERRGPYPPLGFVSFCENELGNGDQFGLYWPIGREDQDPLVAETHHDSWTISPTFSSLDAFLRCAPDPDAWVAPPTLQQDASSPVACLVAGKTSVATGALADAAVLLRRAVMVLPEFGEAQWVLSRLLHRMGDAAGALEAACLAILAPPSWGGASEPALSWLKRQEAPPADSFMLPLWERRLNLSYRFGGSKANSDYVVLGDLIDVYLKQGNGYHASLLMQTFGELMHRETTSFQDRYAFDAKTHFQRQVVVANQFGMQRELGT